MVHFEVTGDTLEPFTADPARALSLLPQLKDPSACELLVLSSADAWARRDPANAWAWATQLTDPSLRETFENRLADQWVDADPDTAIPWLLVNQANQLEYTNSSVVKEWAGANPDGALSFLGLFSDDDTFSRLTADFLEGIASTKPALALSKLDLIKETGQQNTLIESAMSTWSEQDIAAASEYTDALPQGDARQAAIKGIVDAAFKESPESALTWVLTITDPDDQSRETERFLSLWQEKDPIAAQNWLEHAPLDDALRQKLTPSQP